ncbi:hypothetical protein [Sphaerotilus mobilis]|uniref:Lipoprotein n=1 Tax=Sphaerotilus mobilis TaxID=47994 RepID=A0A4V2EWP5_9BURK|nr:hypothetical protein [Sphaerotilus mobilis]RZS56710.1 hypothetical protein EV685_1264 [Sphaerotilus mobilis]
MRHFTAVLLVLVLAACGGGGDDSSGTTSTGTLSKLSTLDGTFSSLSGIVTPDPSTTGQRLDVQASGLFTGDFRPRDDELTIPCDAEIDGRAMPGVACAITYKLVSGEPGDGEFFGTLAITAPAQAVGQHTVCITLRPASVASRADVTTAGPACASVTVTP